jgi:hypothetical protein
LKTDRQLNQSRSATETDGRRPRTDLCEQKRNPSRGPGCALPWSEERRRLHRVRPSGSRLGEARRIRQSLGRRERFGECCAYMIPIRQPRTNAAHGRRILQG